MEVTPHLGLTLPAENEYYDVNIINGNNQKIDSVIGQRAANESLSTELAKKADLSYLQQNYDRKLVNSINLYVSPNGDDVNGDGSEAKPFRNIQKALDVLPKNLGGYNAEIKVASGTYDSGFNANFFYNGLLAIEGDTQNKPVINGDCFVCNIQLRVTQLICLKINGSKTNLAGNGAVTVDNVINCMINSVEIDGIDKTEDGIRIIGQSNVGMSICTINNCNTAVSTNANSGTRGIATVSLYETKGVNNSIGIHSLFAVVGLYSTSIEADTQYYKVGGIIINSDGTLI